MAYSASSLKKIAGGRQGIFYYDSADAIGTIVASGYFNVQLMNLNRMILSLL